jgi:hypothetical protein
MPRVTPDVDAAVVGREGVGREDVAESNCACARHPKLKSAARTARRRAWRSDRTSRDDAEEEEVDEEEEEEGLEREERESGRLWRTQCATSRA